MLESGRIGSVLLEVVRMMMALEARVMVAVVLGLIAPAVIISLGEGK